MGFGLSCHQLLGTYQYNFAVIRKIILAFIVLFVLTWIVMAHMAKSKVISFINNSQGDNIKISYSDASVAGFPFSWTVRFAAPKITIIDQVSSREISSEYLNCVFNYKLSNASLEFGKILHYSAYTDEGQVDLELHSEDKMKLFAKFSKTLFKLDSSSSLRQVTRNIDFSNSLIVALNKAEDELFNLNDVSCNFQNNRSDEGEYLSLKLAGGYKSSFSGHRVNNANLLLDVNYIVPDKGASGDNSVDFDRKLEIVRAKVNLDETSCDLKGNVSLSRSNLPQGKIAVELIRYDDLVDIIVPDDFLFSKPYMKKIVAKAASIEFSNDISDKVNFDIEFTDKGIAFGRVNLLDLK